MAFIFFGSKAYNEIITRLDAIQQALKIPRRLTRDSLKKWLTASELCATLPVCPRTIRRWAKKNIIPYKRAGRLYLFDINAVIEQLERTSENAPITRYDK